ncbi:MAG: exodeoxyribonuclease VII large subunit [Proteobacteria bacterium]|nr:exodeoxyribonuclease VII large subunit [Pseudomonadota bacterium]
MSVFFQTEIEAIVVTGKTYPYRDLLRGLGGQYRSQDKAWLLPLNEGNLVKVEELCRSIGGGRQKPSRSLATQETVSLEKPGETPANLVAMQDGLSVAELMQQVQLALNQNFPRSLWVIGEIQNFRQTATGSYFQLADFKEGASRSATMTVNATIWRSQLADMERKLGREALKELLVDGLRIRILVDVSLFKDRAQVSLAVQSIDPSFTKGSLALARERLLRELRAKGLDQKNKSLAWPAFPLRIGLISADDSRAKSDFLDQLLVYKFPGKVIFYPAQMQGEATLRDVALGVKALEEAGCDMIVITRGGGSAADLRWFDSKEIAYAIAAANVPIVAAIGHHDDVSIAEEICARREKTPTAAADFCIQVFVRSKERIDQLTLTLARQLDERMRQQTQFMQNLKDRLRLMVTQLLGQHKSHVQTLAHELSMRSERQLLLGKADLERQKNNLFQHIQASLFTENHRLNRLTQDLHQKAHKRLHVSQETIQALEKNIIQSDPQPWMAQGWTQLFARGERLLGADQLKVGMHIKARMLDALLELQLIKVESIPPSTQKETRT